MLVEIPHLLGQYGASRFLRYEKCRSNRFKVVTYDILLFLHASWYELRIEIE